MKIDDRGRLYIIEISGGRLLRLDRTTGKIELIADLGPGLDNMTIGPDDVIYVSSEAWGEVYRIDPPSRTASTIVRGGFIAPGGLFAAVSSSGSAELLVADTYTLKTFNSVTGNARVVVKDGHNFLFPT